MASKTKEYSVDVNGETYLVSVDVSDYPEYTINSIENNMGDDVTSEMEGEIYGRIAVDVASDMVCDAEDAADAYEDR